MGPSKFLGGMNWKKIEAVFSHQFFGWQIPLQFHLLGIHESKTSSKTHVFSLIFCWSVAALQRPFYASLKCLFTVEHKKRRTNRMGFLAQIPLTFKNGYRWKECWKVHTYPKIYLLVLRLMLKRNPAIKPTYQFLPPTDPQHNPRHESRTCAGLRGRNDLKGANQIIQVQSVDIPSCKLIAMENHHF